MKITFLGTGTSQGIPVIGNNHPVGFSTNSKDKRLRSSVLVELSNLCFVIDCGPDFRQQMLKANCERLDAIVYTHEHSDHTAGLDDIRPYFFRQGHIPIYAHERVVKSLKKRFDYIFETENKYPGAPSIAVNSIDNKPFYLQDTRIIPINGRHANLQVFGFRVNDFAYLTDMKTIAEEELKKFTNLEALVVNALRIEPHESHFNLKEALALIKTVKPKKTYLTHISHHLGFHDEVEAKLPKNVHLAYDNLVLTL